MMIIIYHITITHLIQEKISKKIRCNEKKFLSYRVYWIIKELTKRKNKR